MSSRDYEQVSWESDSLGRNIQIVQDDRCTSSLAAMWGPFWGATEKTVSK